MPRRPRIQLDRVPLHDVQRGHMHYIALNPVRAALVDDPAHMVLRHLADTLARITRPNEPLYRFGGEEFLFLIQRQAPDGAAAAAQRFINAVRSELVPIPQGKPLALTVTLGLACVGEDELMARAVERADRALYSGKRAGRDRYFIDGG